MYTHTTALGRRVKLEDWLSFHRDRLVAVLYQMRNLGDENGLTLEQVRDVTGLRGSMDAAELVSFSQRKPKLVEMSIRNTVVITERGVRWVDESPERP